MKNLLLLLMLQSLNAFPQDMPAFRQLRYEDDYVFLSKDTSSNWYKKTKYRPLSKKSNSYLSIGGDIRFQYFWFKNENWGEAPGDDDGHVLTRYLAHVNFHANKHFRIFAELQSSQVTGKISTSPVDENPLELHQAFGDFILYPSGDDKLTFRAGRQELAYGSQRLVAIREGPNNRQSFDALRAIYNKGFYKADIFYSHFVSAKKGLFDDGFNKKIKFWGAYLVYNDPGVPLKLDLYYLGLSKAQATFDDGSGKELRHSVGSRLWGSENNLRYDIEGVYQFGRFATLSVSAWTFSINTGFKFSGLKFRPEIGMKTEFISGDKSYKDGKIQTFNPLFPRGGYFGLAAIIGPSNLFDIHPSVSLELYKNVNLNMDYDVFWRYSKNDGIYGPNVAIIYSGKDSDDKYIGRQFSADIAYTPNNYLYLRSELTWFKSGDFLKDVGSGKNILFTAVTVQLKF